MGISIVMGVPQNGWFIMKKTFKQMIWIDLGVPLFNHHMVMYSIPPYTSNILWCFGSWNSRWSISPSPRTWHKEVQVAWLQRQSHQLASPPDLGLGRFWKMWKAHLDHLVLGLDLRVTTCSASSSSASMWTYVNHVPPLVLEWLNFGNPKQTGEVTKLSGALDHDPVH